MQRRYRSAAGETAGAVRILITAAGRHEERGATYWFEHKPSHDVGAVLVAGGRSQTCIGAGVRVTLRATLAPVVATAGCAGNPPPTITADDPAPVEVDNLDLVGVESIDEDQLRAVLRAKPSPWWSEPRALDRAALQEDVQRIVAFYRDHGFPNAAVVASDVALDAAGAEASITIAGEVPNAAHDPSAGAAP
jgi:hypothetical protein